MVPVPRRRRIQPRSVTALTRSRGGFQRCPATDDVAEAIDVAAEHWPEMPARRELLLRVVEQGRCVIERERDGSGRASAGGDPALEQRPDRRGNKGSGAEPTGGGDHESPLR
jgi:hypothetical protein